MATKMKSWLKISLLLCGFGFIRELRPSEPFVTDYLIYPWRNVTSDEVNRSVYPIGTYSYAAQLVLIFLLTDFLRYKPIIILSAAAGIVVWFMLVFTKSLLNLQILELFYGTYMAAEVGYYTYVYAKIDRKHYLKATSHARAAVLCGRFCAGAVGQTLIFLQIADYRDLHIVTAATQILAFIWAFFLPSVKSSQYFHCDTRLNDVLDDGQISSQIEMSIGSRIMEALYLIREHFISSYTNRIVLIWSVWYAAAMCGFLQVISYIQVLWTSIDNTEVIIWNGAVEAGVTLIGAAVALIAGYLRLQSCSERRKLFGLLFLSLGEGLALILASATSSRTISYAGYLIFYTLYSFTITVASAEIAQHIADECYGLVFGFNTLIALVMQTILTLVFVSGDWLHFTIFEQYATYSCYYIALAVCYLFAIIYGAIDSCRSHHH